MSSNRLSSTLLLLVSLLCMRWAYAQNPTDSGFSSSSYTQAAKVYTNSDAARDRLYSGPLYGGYDHHSQGHPFFMTDTLLPGSVFYDGIFFPGLRISYDLTKDVVVMRNDRKDVVFQLMPEKLPYFTVARRRFVYLSGDSSAADVPSAGFYEELYQGKAMALARHKKAIKQVGKTEDNLFVYQQYDYYYLSVGGRYYPIHSEKSMLEAFGPDKGFVRNFVKTSRISYRKDPENALRKTAEYYSQAKK